MKAGHAGPPSIVSRSVEVLRRGRKIWVTHGHQRGVEAWEILSTPTKNQTQEPPFNKLSNHHPSTAYCLKGRRVVTPEDPIAASDPPHLVRLGGPALEIPLRFAIPLCAFEVRPWRFHYGLRARVRLRSGLGISNPLHAYQDGV